MCKMRFIYIYNFIIGLIFHSLQVDASDKYVVISNDGPVVLGGSITFTADLYSHDGSRPRGTFSYSWVDNALHPHQYETGSTTNVTSYWTISYPVHKYRVGSYRVELIVEERTLGFFWHTVARELTIFEVTDLLNGNINLIQSNKTLERDYVSSNTETELKVNMRKGDFDYINNEATSVSTFWFIDCKFYGQTPNFSFSYNFVQPNTTHVIEALVVASFDPIPVTTTTVPTTVVPFPTTSEPNTTTISSNTTAPRLNNFNAELSVKENFSYPFICLNSSIIPPEPNKTYGYFTKEIKVRAPISNITVAGTHWLQPWEMLSLNVSCGGSGPFHKCLLVHPGQYNITGNETCKESDYLESCSFPIIHYFLEPSVYTIVVILDNDVSKEIYPLTITIYTATPKPQLSVIIVPVSCSLAAVVLIVFGVAYYIQSRDRFTVEVADFDFGQHNPEMEYKTFTERLRDSFNNTLRPGGDRISVRPPYYGRVRATK